MSLYTDELADTALRKLRLQYATICAEWAALKFEMALRRAQAETKYNPNWRNQPRAPAGAFDGGRWVGDGSSAGRSTSASPRTGTLVLPPPPPENVPGQLPLRLLGRVGGAMSLPLALSGDTPQPKVNAYAIAGALDLVIVHIDRRATGGQSGYFARIIGPALRQPLSIFGIDTGIGILHDARTRRLDVPVSIVKGEARFDPAALARAYGRDIPGVTSATKPPKPKQLSTVPGSGVETQNAEEASLAAAMRAQGRSSADIQMEFEHERGASSERSLPPRVFKRRPPLHAAREVTKLARTRSS